MTNKTKELVAAGHALAKELHCAESAALVRELATQLDVQHARADALVTDNEKAMESLKQADAAVKSAHEKFSALAAENEGLKTAMSVTLEHVSVMDTGQAGVAAMIINDALHNSETPATDRIIADVQSKTLEAAAAEIARIDTIASTAAIAFKLRELAVQMREAK